MFSLSRGWILLLWLCAGFPAATVAAEPAAVTYVISLRSAPSHYIDVAMGFAAKPHMTVQLPVWNATYVVRNFAANISDMRLHRADVGEQVLHKVDKATWQVPQESGAVELRYRIYLNDPGPFGAEVSAEHAFFNFAQVLPYIAGDEHKQQLTTVSMVDVPAEWKMAIPLPHLGGPRSGGQTGSFTMHAESYDRLVDSPAELGNFEERDFSDAGKKYRVIVHGAAGDYDIGRMVNHIQKIVHAETDFMRESPFEEYTFIYHVGGVGGGGMEHAYSTAIGLPPLKDDRAWRSFDNVTAHEFFHLWNVKRIIPQELAPVDYTREMYTRELWFSEGVTSTVAEYMLLRTGLNDEQHFQEALARSIQQLRSRPAHAWQSPEESSLDTWLDDNPYYGSRDRSVSYYLSGELIGFLLDLDMREHSRGQKSLGDLLRAMNEDYAHRGKFFPDDAVQDTASRLTGMDYSQFFAQNVANAGDLPFESELASVGWRLDSRMVRVGDAGFDFARGPMGHPTISRVRSAEAQQAGLREGDQIVEVEGTRVQTLREAISKVGAFQPGSTVYLIVQRDGVPVKLRLSVMEREETQYTIADLLPVTADQLSRRRAWLGSEDQP